MSRIRTNIITNRMANGAPTVSNGLVISGITTTSEILVGNTIKLDPVAGIVTAPAVDVNDFLNIGSNIKLGNAGVITATSFSGSGANLTSLPAGQLTGTIADARLSTVSSSKLSGALPAIDGSALTGVGVGTADSINTSGIITASHFVPTTQGSLGKRNLILNGEFQIDERMGGSATAITPTGGVDYTCDMWHESNYGGEAARITYQQRNADTPTPNYRQAIRLDVTTAMGTPSGNNWMGFSQFIESQNIHFLGHGTSSAKPITLQFWIKSTKTGTATVGINRSDAAREYLAEYTISASDTWEFKTITFPGDTSGTEAGNDNGRGFMIYWCLFAGSTRHGTLNNWRTLSGGYYGASANQVNLLDNTSNFVLFAGVQLEVGNVATPFEHQTFSQDLNECRRYFYKPHTSNGYIYGGRWGNNSTYVNVYYPVQMRDTPTIGGSARHGGGTSNVGKDYFSYNIGQDDNWWQNFTASAHL